MRLSLKEVPVLLLCGLLFCSSSCNKDEDIPACIKKEIDASVPIGEIELVRVERYEFQDEKVYVFNYEGGADFQTPVFDENCNSVCALGGFAGITECREQEFYGNATLEEVVWEK